MQWSCRGQNRMVFCTLVSCHVGGELSSQCGCPSVRYIFVMTCSSITQPIPDETLLSCSTPPPPVAPPVFYVARLPVPSRVTAERQTNRQPTRGSAPPFDRACRTTHRSRPTTPGPEQRHATATTTTTLTHPNRSHRCRFPTLPGTMPPPTQANRRRAGGTRPP